MKQSREGERGRCHTLLHSGDHQYQGIGGHRGLATAHLHWTLETLDTPDTDNTQPAAKLIDDTQNINYMRPFSISLKEQNPSSTTRK